MMLLTIKVAPSSLAAVLKAIAPLIPSHQIELYEPAPIPPTDGLDEAIRRLGIPRKTIWDVSPQFRRFGHKSGSVLKID
ncbi:hypothetical protein [Sinorhizobium meliloti]|uniref:hypothetical protein n=1 Tax=Rhizobium meliloti TaxID=382 RepID=UPI00035CC185|nr:hypothetical protein [Sinorhizobium meliloti]